MTRLADLNTGNMPTRSLRIPDELWAKAQRIARERGVSPSSVVWDAIDSLPEPVSPVASSGGCSGCETGIAIYHHADKRSLCEDCERKERPPMRKLVTSIATAVIAVAVTWGGWAWQRPRLDYKPPKFGYLQAGRVQVKPFIIRNVGSGRLWGSIRQAGDCGPDYSIVLPRGKVGHSVHYILGRGGVLVVPIRYAPMRDGKQPCAFTVGQR